MAPKEHWEKFKALHSVATSLWVENNFGKSFTRQEFIKEHADTCKSRYSAVACAKNLFSFLVKWDWIQDASAE